MRRAWWAWIFLAFLLGPARGAPPSIRLVEFETSVTGATANRILRSIEDAEEAGDDLVLIQLDTPGGDIRALQRIVKGMLNASRPIVVWVGPAGAQAASAGFFILIAADVAAMAPGTRCGAAATIYGTGEGKEDDVLLKKINADMAALLRSIAERRGRNVDVAEKAVMAAEAWSEREALDAKLIDLVAATREELLGALEGRQIRRFDGSTVRLQTKDARFVQTEFGARQELYEFIANPIVAPLLLLIGLTALYIELNHPGLVLPGLVGALCLVLFFFAAQALPVSTIGVLLILLGLVMFILEIKIVSYGMLTLGGAVCLAIGAMMLIEGPIPELRVPPAAVLPGVLVCVGVLGVVVRLALRAQRSPVATGVEGLVGEVGTVEKSLDPEGKVFVHGELWDAVAVGGSVARGRRVRVVRTEGLRLVVEPWDAREGG